MQLSPSNTSKEEIKLLLSLYVCPLAGFSVARFPRATIFKCNVENLALADQVKKWYELDSYGTFKQADPRSAADKRAQKFLDSTTLHDGSRYVVGMLWAEDNIHLHDNFYASLVQLKSLEKGLGK